MILFYEIYDRHYIVYWDKFNTDAWAQKKKEYEAELKRQEEIKARTVDIMRIGEMNTFERDHNLQEKIPILPVKHLIANGAMQ